MAKLSAIAVAAFLSAPTALIAAKSQTPDAQIYECKPDATGRLTWQFREPIAALFADGLTVGRHYAGPSWELNDGSLITGKTVARAPGATPSDIPWLKLEATVKRTMGSLTRAVSIQRLNTKGGVAEGACDEPGAMMSAPYAADYAFLRKRS